MNFQKYSELGGAMSEDEFSSLYPAICVFLQSYVESYIASWNIKESFEDYGNFEDAVFYQMEFIESIGGTSVMNGMSDLDIKSADAKGFKYEIQSHVDRYNGIPVSPLAKQLMLKELRKNGYLSRCLNA